MSGKSIVLLDRLAKWCETHIFEELLDENNALAIHKLFTTLGSSVAGRVEQYVKKTFPAIAQTEEFLKLSYEDVKKLLLATDLHTSSEQEVFYAAMRWIEFSPERIERASGLLMCVRLSLLSEAFLTNSVRLHPTVRRCRECRDL
ncbi:hypothetical protein Y032_0497g2492, partial [Ancylostoma ceylanicum]